MCSFNRAFGMTMLVMLASCLLHLVASSYFLFVDVLGDPVSIGVEILYIIQSFYRIILLNIELVETGLVCCIPSNVVVLLSCVATASHRRTMSYGHIRGKSIVYLYIDLKFHNDFMISHYFRRVNQLPLFVKRYESTNTPPLSQW